jgi:cytoskeleton protein RodZ
MAEIGNILREARIRKGLTIKDVEAATRIRIRYLQALENDDFDMLPGTTFSVAFLRTYAQFLKLDADELIGEYRRTHDPRGRDDSTVPRSASGLASRSGASPVGQRRKRRRNPRGFALVALLAVVVLALAAWFGTTLGKGPQTGADMSLPSQETSSTVLSDVSSTTTAAKASTSTSTTVLSGGNVTLLLKVTDKSCWMVVREDSASGAELFAGTLSAGGQKTFDSAKRYWLMVGAPEVLSVTVDGRDAKLAAGAGAYSVTETGAQVAQ